MAWFIDDQRALLAAKIRRLVERGGRAGMSGAEGEAVSPGVSGRSPELGGEIAAIITVGVALAGLNLVIFR